MSYPPDIHQATGRATVGSARLEPETSTAQLLRQLRMYEALSRCMAAIATCGSRSELYSRMCAVVVETVGFRLAWVGETDAQGWLRPVASAGDAADYLKGIRISIDANDPHGRGPTGISVRENRPFWCQDVDSDPAVALWRERAKRFGLHASASLPIRLNGKAIGAFAMYAGESFAFDEGVQRLMIDLTEGIGIALTRFEAEALARAERAQAETTRRQSERRHRTLLETAMDGFVLADTQGRLLEVNDAYCRMTGYSQQELLAMHIADLEAAESSGDVAAHAERMIVRGEDRFESRQRRKDGSEFDVEVGVQFRPEDGGRFVSFVRDITARKKTEQLLRRSEERLRMAQEGAHVGVWELDVATNEVYWSAELMRQYGLPPGAPRSNDEWRKRVHPDDLPRIDAQWDEKIRHGEPFEAEFRFFPDAGEMRWMLTRGIAVADAAGHPVRLVGINLDITERKRAEAALQAAKEDADAANVAKSVFLATMSHEIRTPLNAILGLTQVLEHSVADPEELDIVRRIRAAGDLLLRSLNDVLDLSQIETGQLEIEHRPFRVGRVLANVGDLVGEMARGKGLALRIAAAGCDELRVVGDATRLEQVLLNLLGNAIKFTEGGDIALRVHSLARAGRSLRLRFEVQDSGIGIAADKMATLFTPFTQADSGIKRRFGGTGLGLSICKRLVELMGGEIGVDSAEGVGSTFWFEVPAELATTGTFDEPAAVSRPPRTAGSRLAGLRLLVVDDSAMNLDLAERVLTREGAVVTLATDGRRTLELLGQKPDAFDAVLIDLQMPVLDGLAATRAIRGELGMAALPVIAWSAGVYAEDRAAALDAGANAFIAKPIDVTELVAVLRRSLRSLRSPLPPVSGAGAKALPSAGSLEPEREPLPMPEPMVTSTSLPQITGIDRQQVETMLGGDREMFLELLRGFVAECGDSATRIEAALARGDRADAAVRLHKVRGTAGYLGATDVVRSSRQLEDALKSDGSEIPALFAEYARCLATLVQAAGPWLAAPVAGAG